MFSTRSVHPSAARAPRRSWRSWRACTVLLSVLLLPALAQGRTLEVSHAARALQPGEVVLLDVTASEPLRSLGGKAFGKVVLFHPEDDGRRWRGLAGIDLEIAAGTYTVALTGSTAAGRPVAASHTLVVASKAFPTRRLTVAPRFVTPPPEVQERIRRESERMAAIFRTLSPGRLWSGTFLRPVPGAATSSFGVRSVLNNQPRSPHTGTDFRGAEGTPVKAPAAGRVALAADLYYSGNAVILDHGQGLFSLFAHLSRITVQEGDLVAAGDLVGHIGATGRVTGPHLHWAVRLVGARVDPLSLMAVLEEAIPAPATAESR